jgi:hypothetical protein
MKKMVIVGLVLLSASLSAQPNRSSTMSLLKWLIKRDHIVYLEPKSSAAVFYDKDAFSKQTLITDSAKDIPNKSLADYLSPTELQTAKATPPMLMQTYWRKNYAKLRVKFVTDKLVRKIMASHAVFIFSEPVFLNKQKTRVLIGEYFICGDACGRDDLLLCEFQNGYWQLVARAVINND